MSNYVKVIDNEIASDILLEDNVKAICGGIISDEKLREHNLVIIQDIKLDLDYGNHADNTGLILNPDGTVSINYRIKNTAIESLQAEKIEKMKALFNAAIERPIIDTGLGFKVKAGRADLEDYKDAQALGFPKIRDADNVMHDIDDAGWIIVISAIRQYGADLFTEKLAIEQSILDAETPADLQNIILDSAFNTVTA